MLGTHTHKHALPSQDEGVGWGDKEGMATLTATRHMPQTAVHHPEHAQAHGYMRVFMCTRALVCAPGPICG